MITRLILFIVALAVFLALPLSVTFAAEDTLIVIKDSTDAGPPEVFPDLNSAMDQAGSDNIPNGDIRWILITEGGSHYWDKEDTASGRIVHDHHTSTDGGRLIVKAIGAAAYDGERGADSTYRFYGAALTPVIDIEEQVEFVNIQFEGGAGTGNLFQISSPISTADTLKLTNCTLSDATAAAITSGITAVAYYVWLENCLVYHNGDNGISYVNGSTATTRIEHSIIAANGADGIQMNTSTVWELRNSVICFNVGVAVDSIAGTITPSYSSVDDISFRGWTGTGLDSNATFTFADTSTGDYHWTTDANHHDAPRLSNILTDIDGDSRPATNTGRGYDHYVAAGAAPAFNRRRKLLMGVIISCARF